MSFASKTAELEFRVSDCELQLAIVENEKQELLLQQEVPIHPLDLSFNIFLNLLSRAIYLCHIHVSVQPN